MDVAKLLRFVVLKRKESTSLLAEMAMMEEAVDPTRQAQIVMLAHHHEVKTVHKHHHHALVHVREKKGIKNDVVSRW